MRQVLVGVLVLLLGLASLGGGRLVHEAVRSHVHCLVERREQRLPLRTTSGDPASLEHTVVFAGAKHPNAVRVREDSFHLHRRQYRAFGSMLEHAMLGRCRRPVLLYVLRRSVHRDSL